jgi:hypothetical protein
MAFTTADLANVEQAIISLATGKRSTKFVIDGNVVEYSTVELPALRILRGEIAGELAAVDSESGTVSAFCFSGGKGL